MGAAAEEDVKMPRLEMRNLNPRLGVEVMGLEPRAPLDAETGHILRALFDDRGLLVFRGLEVDAALQTYLAGLLIGEDRAPAAAPAAPAASTQEREAYSFVSNRGRGNAPFGRLPFHTDMMWSEDAFQLISLYGVEIEEPAIPTLFVSATHAWTTLPTDLRARVEGRFAIHGRESRTDGDGEVLVTTYKTEQTVKLPIGRRHPRTGETILYVDQRSTYGLADMPQADSDELLAALYAHLYAPENVVEHHWRPGDLLLWDNLALQHARPNVSVEGPARVLRKVYAPKPRMARSAAPEYSTAGS
jgi:alpha-ketoglutarate-dependent taurine dioxygenase